MITKHFFKVLTIFILMILLGLVGVFAINRFGEQNTETATVKTTTKTQAQIPPKPCVGKKC
jgi:uncharacterized membrane protein AbrB (regulator of aidB expression)